MPIEYTALRDRPVPLEMCPNCDAEPFHPLMRGMVQNYWRRLFRRPYCCLICAACKEIVGYEKP